MTYLAGFVLGLLAAIALGLAVDMDRGLLGALGLLLALVSGFLIAAGTLP